MSQINGDDTTSVAALKSLVASFVADRQWEVFHNPKNLATSVCIEAAELAEHFQWLTTDQSMESIRSIGNDHPIAQEMADVLSYLLAMANVTGVDLAKALQLKMHQNAYKYPIPNLSETSVSMPSDDSRFPTMDGG